MNQKLLAFFFQCGEHIILHFYILLFSVSDSYFNILVRTRIIYKLSTRIIYTLPPLSCLKELTLIRRPQIRQQNAHDWENPSGRWIVVHRRETEMEGAVNWLWLAVWGNELTFYPVTGEFGVLHCCQTASCVWAQCFTHLKYLVGRHFADRVARFQCLQLLQTPVQFIQSLNGQLLVWLLCGT